MKTYKVIVVATTVAILAVATLGVVLGHTYSRTPYFSGITGYSPPYQDEDWWTEMEEHMRYRWGDAFDEEWLDEMRGYMEERFEEVQEQEWFEEMKQFMEDRWESQEYGYGYRDYQRSYRRGCWGW